MKRMGCPAQIFLQHMFVRGSEPGAEEGYVKTGERLNENGGSKNKDWDQYILHVVKIDLLLFHKASVTFLLRTP
jgi:hypothetical protein